MGPLPAAGDLLRAMRLRGDWTQAQLAHRLGVGQNTVARWEHGERLPSAEQMQALCFALEAREDELVALTTGRFTEAAAALPTDPAALLEHIHHLLYSPGEKLADLQFLTAEHKLWKRAAQDARLSPLLATVYAEYAHYLSLYRRWDEVRTQAQRALALTPSEGPTPNYILRAVLKLAAAEVYGGNRPTPDRGILRINAWLSRSPDVDYTGWMLSDMGKYRAMAGEAESALELGKKALGITKYEQEMRLLDHCRLLAAAGYPGKALEQLPTLGERDKGMFVYEAVIRCEAYLNLDEPEEASVWLERAYVVIETEGLIYDRAQADALSQRIHTRLSRR